jgi:hypothetical protein
MLKSDINVSYYTEILYLQTQNYPQRYIDLVN